MKWSRNTQVRPRYNGTKSNGNPTITDHKAQFLHDISFYSNTNTEFHP